MASSPTAVLVGSPRRVVVSALLLLAASAPLTSHALHETLPGSTFCDGTGTPATGEGASSQLGVHVDVFRPAFAAACPDAVAPGYLGTGDANAFLRLHERSRDFGGSDVPLTPVEKFTLENDVQSSGLRGRVSPIHQMPLYVDALAIGYNVSCIPPGATLNLRSQTLSLIYSGLIKTWNHPLLQQDNPSLHNCSLPIGLVKRVGYAGATTVLKDFLSKRNPQWNYYKQPSRNQEWPPDATFVVCAASNEDGMASCLNSTVGAIGYLQLRVAGIYGVRVAAIDNPVSAATLTFIPPSADSCAKAAETVVTVPTVREDLPVISIQSPPTTELDWSTVSITDAPLGYPICNFGYLFIFGRWTSAYGAQNSSGALRTMVDYLWVATSSATQGALRNHDFAPLPERVLKAVRAGIEAIRLT